MMVRRARVTCWLVLAMALGFRCLADVSLPSVIGKNMVLQSDCRAPIWGWAPPGEHVTVTLGDQSKKTEANKQGYWKVRLKPMPAGGPHTLFVRGRNEIVVEDVYIGEVWVCSGQSNMAWPVNATVNAEQEVAQAAYPQIRLFRVKNEVADAPRSNCKAEWVPCSPDAIPGFSAVAYYFGRELHQTLKKPVGLIFTAWGGTPAESWISKEKLASDPDFKPILDRYAEALKAYPQAKEEYEKKLAAWKEEEKKAKEEGRKAPHAPGAPIGPGHHWSPSGLYNAMINPLIPYAVSGAIWYQGESNADRAYQYRKLLPGLIRDWRERWGQKHFFFGIVQLANFMKLQDDPNKPSPWAELREAQAMTVDALPDVGLAVAIDIGDANDIHPKNKQDVGKRLALWALGDKYDQELEFSGPVYKSAKIQGDRVKLAFDHVGAGLEAKGGDLKGFVVAGEDKVFKWAQAQIEGDAVLVWSPEVLKPVAVRYGWADNPTVTLYNRDGLPACPFRTDDWPEVTAQAK